MKQLATFTTKVTRRQKCTNQYV